MLAYWLGVSLSWDCGGGPFLSPCWVLGLAFSLLCGWLAGVFCFLKKTRNDRTGKGSGRRWGAGFGWGLVWGSVLAWAFSSGILGSGVFCG